MFVFVINVIMHNIWHYKCIGVENSTIIRQVTMAFCDGLQQNNREAQQVTGGLDNHPDAVSPI